MDVSRLAGHQSSLQTLCCLYRVPVKVYWSAKRLMGGQRCYHRSIANLSGRLRGLCRTGVDRWCYHRRSPSSRRVVMWTLYLKTSYAAVLVDRWYYSRRSPSSRRVALWTLYLKAGCAAMLVDRWVSYQSRRYAWAPLHHMPSLLWETFISVKVLT